MIFEEKIKPLNRTKRFAGRFWPIEAGRPIEKHGLRVNYYKVQGFFRKIFYERKPYCELILIKFKGFFVKCLGFGRSWPSSASAAARTSTTSR
jgi:hypothetical protein